MRSLFSRVGVHTVLAGMLAVVFLVGLLAAWVLGDVGAFVAGNWHYFAFGAACVLALRFLEPRRWSTREYREQLDKAPPLRQTPVGKVYYSMVAASLVAGVVAFMLVQLGWWDPQ